MSRLNYDSVVEMLHEEISNKNKSINLEVDLISKCGYADEVINRSLYLATVLAGRDALIAFLGDLEAKDAGE